MKKEVGIAVFFGILLGLSVAVVIITQIRQFDNKGVKSLPGNETAPAVKKQNTQIQTLEISSVKDGAITNKNSVLIKGKTEKNSLLVIQSPTKDITVQNKEEAFSVTFPLSLGENSISITSYPKDRQSSTQSKLLKVYYFDQE
ncbi:MAG: hypothetical protein AAB966_01210 [Patescibacteria group bacterium]